MIKKLILKDLNAICLGLGPFLSLIPVFLQLLYNDMPVEGEHVFTHFANQIIINGNISLLNALLSIIGATLTAFGIFGLINDLQKNKSDNLMVFSVFLFLIATIGFIISWSQDFILVWGDANLAPSQMMIEFSLIFSFGILYWSSIAILSYRLLTLKFLNTNLLIALSTLSSINIFLIIYTLFTFDPYNASTVNLLYLGFIAGSILFYVFCFLAARKNFTK